MIAAAFTACGGDGGSGSSGNGSSNPNAFAVSGDTAIRLMAGAVQVPKVSLAQTPAPLAFFTKDQFAQDSDTLAMTFLGDTSNTADAYTFSGTTKEISGNNYFAQGRWVSGSLHIDGSPTMNGDYTLNEPLQSISYLVFNPIKAFPDHTSLTYCFDAVATTATASNYYSENPVSPSWADLPDTATVSGKAYLTFNQSYAIVTMNLTVKAGNTERQFDNIKPAYIAAPFYDAQFQQGQGLIPNIHGTASIGYAGNDLYLLAVQYRTAIDAPTLLKEYAGTLYFVCQRPTPL